MNPRTLLAAVGLGSSIAKKLERTRRRAALFRDCAKLFMLEARDNPKDRAYLLACARDLYRRYRAISSSGV